MGAHRIRMLNQKNSLENIPPRITMHLLLGWSLPKKMGRFFKKWPLFRFITLPETNIAMENPSFWWYLPGKMEIFMGYVSFREGTPLLPRLPHDIVAMFRSMTREVQSIGCHGIFQASTSQQETSVQNTQKHGTHCYLKETCAVKRNRF